MKYSPHYMHYIVDQYNIRHLPTTYTDEGNQIHVNDTKMPT